MDLSDFRFFRAFCVCMFLFFVCFLCCVFCSFLLIVFVFLYHFNLRYVTNSLCCTRAHRTKFCYYVLASPLSMQMGIPLTLPALRAGSQDLTKRCHLQTHYSLSIYLCGCASAGSKVIRGITAREEGEPGDEATFVVVFKFVPLGKKKSLA